MSESIEVKINGKKADLSMAMPFTLGDMRKLKSKGVDLNKMAAESAQAEKDGESVEVDIDAIAELIFYFSHKANSKISMDDVNELAVSEMQSVSEKISEMFTASQETETDRPT